jgi:hypothetical protein
MVPNIRNLAQQQVRDQNIARRDILVPHVVSVEKRDSSRHVNNQAGPDSLRCTLCSTSAQEVPERSCIGCVVCGHVL